MKKTIYYIGIVAVILLMIFAAYYTFRYVIPTRLVEGEYKVYTVDYGAVTKTIEAQGIVVPENEVLIRSVSNGVIKKIINSPGSEVRHGEIILIMDTVPIKRDIESAEDQLDVMRNNLRKNKLNARSTEVDLDYNVETKKLRIASAKSELSDQEQLLEVGGISPAKIEKTKQELVLAEKELESILEKNSIRIKQLEAEEEGLLLQITIKEKELENKREILKDMIVRAPSSGLVLNIYGNEGDKFNAGDVLVQVSNLNSYKITGSIDEKFADVIKTGGSVYTKLDKRSLPGKIGRVKPVIENNKVNFDVFLEESSHPKLIPNMKVELEVVRAFRDSVLRVKIGDAFEGARLTNAFVIEDGKAIRKEIQIGLIGSRYFEVLRGLEAGEKVIVSDVQSFRHMKVVEIENH
ncbi:MAG: efflux RND transporter periplasmic adaptor subunit [Bacteroidales bacterium]|nr:efflux RND transporter periplasmic adaptor subunit [Bacteroidales bacterium]MCF8389103.1 efflux RND transporter periplasmic adaptor subunit [Bacteroidales bacterium]